MHRMAAVALLLNEHRWDMICIGWFTLGTAFVLCEVVLFLLISLQENPDTVSWRVGFFVAASVPGIVLLYFERRIIAWQRSARLASLSSSIMLTTNPTTLPVITIMTKPPACKLKMTVRAVPTRTAIHAENNRSPALSGGDIYNTSVRQDTGLPTEISYVNLF